MIALLFAMFSATLIASARGGMVASVALGSSGVLTLEDVSKKGSLGDVECDFASRPLVFRNFSATTTNEGAKTAKSATIHFRVYRKDAGDQRLNGVPIERGVFLEVDLAKDGALAGDTQKWSSTFEVDLFGVAGVTKPGLYTIDFFGSAQLVDGSTPFYYSNFGANFKVDVNVKDDAAMSCSKGPWVNLIAASSRERSLLVCRLCVVVVTLLFQSTVRFAMSKALPARRPPPTSSTSS